jgi:hypothetical protein
MEDKEIYKQAIKDWEELKKRFKKDGTLEYGIVKGFVVDGKFKEYVYVNMGNGQCIVFDSIKGVELNIKENR